MQFGYQTILYSIPPHNYQEELSKQKPSDFNIVQYELIVFIMKSKHVAVVFINTCDLVLAYESRLNSYSLSPIPNINYIYFSSIRKEVVHISCSYQCMNQLFISDDISCSYHLVLCQMFQLVGKTKEHKYLAFWSLNSLL